MREENLSPLFVHLFETTVMQKTINVIPQRLSLYKKKRITKRYGI